MKIAFRIECPHCHWGFPWSDNYVNQGWIKLVCRHCHKTFYTKIYIPNVNIEVQSDKPEAPIKLCY